MKLCCLDPTCGWCGDVSEAKRGEYDSMDLNALACPVCHKKIKSFVLKEAVEFPFLSAMAI